MSLLVYNSFFKITNFYALGIFQNINDIKKIKMANNMVICLQKMSINTLFLTKGSQFVFLVCHIGQKVHKNVLLLTFECLTNSEFSFFLTYLVC